MSPSADFVKGWHRLLQDVELARNYHRVYALDDALVGRSPFLDQLLASFVFLRLLSLLDDALEQVAASDPAVVFKNKKAAEKQDLFDKIDALATAGHLSAGQAEDLHGMRKWRNALAHDPHPMYLDWRVLDKAVAIVDGVLQHLGMAGPQPKYEFFAERSAAESSEDPQVLASYRYQVGLKEEGVPEITLHWTSRIMKEASS